MRTRPTRHQPLSHSQRLGDAPDIRDRLLAVQEKSGFIPNVFFVLAHRPDEVRAFLAYHDALMDIRGRAPTGLALWHKVEELRALAPGITSAGTGPTRITRLKSGRDASPGRV